MMMRMPKSSMHTAPRLHSITQQWAQSGVEAGLLPSVVLLLVLLAWGQALQSGENTHTLALLSSPIGNHFIKRQSHSWEFVSSYN